MRRRVGYAAGWLVAVVAAVTVGVVTVSAVGASLTGRGPLGDEVIRHSPDAAATAPAEETVPTETASTEAVPTQDAAPTEAASPPGERLSTRVFTEEFGALEVGCRGPYAVGVAITPDEAAGWRVVSYDAGPDEDVEAVLVRGGRSAEIEVFCNRGVPTIADLEYDDEAEDPADD